MKRKLSISATVSAAAEVLSGLFKEARKVQGRPKIFATIGVMPLGNAMPQFAIIGASKELALSIYVLEDYESLVRYKRMIESPQEAEESGLEDFVHSVILIPRRDGARMQIMVGKPGYLPRRCSSVEKMMLQDVAREVYNFLLRVEDAGSLVDWKQTLGNVPQTNHNIIFIRKQLDSGEWTDGFFEVCKEPDLSVPHIDMRPETIAQLAKVHIVKGQALAVGLASIKGCAVTRDGVCPYFLICADMKTGKPICVRQIRINPNEEQVNMQWLWRRLLVELVLFFQQQGTAPETICVTSHCMRKYMRMLCEYLPFKLVFHENIPVLAQAAAEVFAKKPVPKISKGTL